jgi:hypothetical protein
VPGPGCFFWPPEVDALPESYSPFGVHLMATIYEWTSTHYREGWAWIPDGTVDPPSPPAATYPEWTDRGYRTPSDGSVRVPSTTSGRGSLVGSEDFLSIRCTY